MRTAWTALFLLATAGGEALAQNDRQIICSEPIRPTCVDSEITYDSEETISRCESDIQRYAGQVQEFLDCLDRKKESYREALDAVQKSFRCRAEDGEGC